MLIAAAMKMSTSMQLHSASNIKMVGPLMLIYVRTSLGFKSELILVGIGEILCSSTFQE